MGEVGARIVLGAEPCGRWTLHGEREETALRLGSIDRLDRVLRVGRSFGIRCELVPFNTPRARRDRQLYRPVNRP